MEREELLKEAKNRRKHFLKEMPDDQRRLLKMHQKTVHHAKSLLYAIPVLILILIVLFFSAGFYFHYEKRWLINGIILAVLCLTGTSVLLFIRSSALKRMKALSSTMPEFINEYEKIEERINELKKR